jgi:hypothetical protein
MAHFRKGQTVKAAQWLKRSQDSRSQASTQDESPYDVEELRLLRAEAEAVVLYDPIFPRDPFAHLQEIVAIFQKTEIG